MNINITTLLISTFVSALIALSLLFISLFLSNDIISNTETLSFLSIILGVVFSIGKKNRAIGLGILFGGGIPLLYILSQIK